MAGSIAKTFANGAEQVVTTVASDAAKETGVVAKESGSWLGRTLTTVGQGIKTVAIKVGNAITSFFKNIGTHAQSGFFVGAIGAGVGVGGIIAVNLLAKDHTAARVALTILFAGAIFAAGAVMFAFGKNPISFSRALTAA
jgi:hypothetical protein